MPLSPEERRRIYEEEKARIEAEQKQRMTAGGSSTELEPNVAGLLCYLGGWISGIVFLVIEQKNRFVRFHALQSIVTFAALTVAGALLGWIPYAGSIFGTIIGILAFILWVVLMVKAYQGELYRVPLAGQVAEGLLRANWRGGKPETREQQKRSETTSTEGTEKPPGPQGAQAQPISEKAEESGKRTEDYFTRTRAGRIAGYSVAIFFSVVFLIFFSFFHRYIAWYHTEPDGGVTRLPLLTSGYFTWLPVLVTALAISIAAHILLIVYDRYWLREVTHVILNAIGVAVVVKLIAVFPFNFSVIPNPAAADIMPVAVTVVLVIIAVGLGIGALVRLIKLLVGLTQ
jgi:uncharacterized membrane protein